MTKLLPSLILIVNTIVDPAPMIKSADKVPSMYSACWSVTSYWPFNEDDELEPWNGQADSNPEFTANMTPVTVDREWTMAGGPLPLVGRTFVFPDGTKLAITDTFGHPDYQAGVFWHDGYETWVIGVDVFTSDPLHYLTCEGVIQ